MEYRNPEKIMEDNSQYARRKEKRKNRGFIYKSFSLFAIIMISGYLGYAYGYYEMGTGYKLKEITVKVDGTSIESLAKLLIPDLSIDRGVAMIAKANNFASRSGDARLHKGDKIIVPTRGGNSILNKPYWIPDIGEAP